tara:strand:+ start:495 stop:1106 length:612 start_codon:yes stop_codon:yes gene_type:complete
LIKRTSKKFIDITIKNNPNWNILDIGCGFTAHENAKVVCDVQDLSNFYKDKQFVKLNNKILPFKDKEFDFVIASHVLEHVEDINGFVTELERVSNKGYIELPTILEDNLVFENKNDHLWQMEFDDVDNMLIISNRIQFIEPILTVSSAKIFSNFFKQSLNLELFWENSIDYKIIKKNIKIDKRIFRFNLFRKFLSKLLRNILR